MDRRWDKVAERLKQGLIFDESQNGIQTLFRPTQDKDNQIRLNMKNDITFSISAAFALETLPVDFE